MSRSESRPACTWVDTDAAFTDLARHLEGLSEVALDTESDGFHHYFDKLCLLQISSREENWVVDTLALESLDPLRRVLLDEAVLKVLHAPEQDIMYLRRDHQLEVRGLFDTSVAAQFLGHERLGLANLLEAYFQLKLSKTSQRDDWSVRPLTPLQIDYAVADTAYLLELTDRLRAGLEEKSRMEWALEEFAALELKEIDLASGDPLDISRVKGWNKLPPEGTAVLQELLRWRDEEARKRDRPPFRIVGSALLLDLATAPPADRKELLQRKGLPRHRAERLAGGLLSAIQRGLNLPEAEIPTDPRSRGRRPPPRRRDPAFEARREALRAWRKKKAAALELAPGTVLPQRDVDRLAAEPPNSPAGLAALDDLRHWRRREFGPEWLEILKAR